MYSGEKWGSIVMPGLECSEENQENPRLAPMVDFYKQEKTTKAEL